MRHVIVGTAGHIDHGKTALVRALTGIDTDTLPEEKARGVTIDIGFAYWKDNVTFIDVPGHERFVKNMVTGVCSVDLAIFVVAGRRKCHPAPGRLWCRGVPSRYRAFQQRVDPGPSC